MLIHDGLFSFWTNQIFPQYVSPILSIIYKDTESIICGETLVKIRFHFHSMSSLWPLTPLLEVLACNTSQKQKCQKNGDRLLEFVVILPSCQSFKITNGFIYLAKLKDNLKNYVLASSPQIYVRYSDIFYYGEESWHF